VHDVFVGALAILVLDKVRRTRHSRKAICDFANRRYWVEVVWL